MAVCVHPPVSDLDCTLLFAGCKQMSPRVGSLSVFKAIRETVSVTPGDTSSHNDICAHTHARTHTHHVWLMAYSEQKMDSE